MEFDIVKAILSKKEDFLRRHLVLSSSVIEKLRQHDVIGQYTQDQMTKTSGNTELQLTHLFVCLRTRGMPAFNGFLKVLHMTFHGWLANDILDTPLSAVEAHQVKHASALGNVVRLRDVINQMYTSQIEAHPKNADDLLDKLKKTSPLMANDFVDKPEKAKSLINNITGTLDNGRILGTKHIRPEKSTVQNDVDEKLKRNEKEDKDGRVSPITTIPKNLRDLERVFESESYTTRNSLASLKQEEIRIRALLQQNLREQQDLMSKQDALIEIKDKMKEISKSATQLFRPDPEVRLPIPRQPEPETRSPTTRKQETETMSLTRQQAPKHRSNRKPRK